MTDAIEKNSVDMSVNMPGLALKNPVITASGTFGYGPEYAPFGALESLGGIIVKGLSLKPRQGNPMPRMTETACGMLNAVGLQNVGVEVFLNEKLPQVPWRDVPVIANLYACSPDEFGELAAVLDAEEGIAAIEVNISCPNVSAGGALFGADPLQAASVTSAVKKRAVRKPVIVKLSPNVTDIAEIARAVEGAGADMISCINTLTGMAVDLRTRGSRIANVFAGLSGPAIKPVALRCVYQVAKAVSIPVIGLGGIASAEDALEFICVGAHAVQVGTANFLRPDFAFRLVDEMAELMTELGIDSIEELRGSFRP